MNYWLMKSEPDEFSLADLQAKGIEPWHGIRNYQARNFIRDQLQLGDLVLFYHSSCKVPAVVGIAEVASAPRIDQEAFNPASPYFDPKSDPTKPKWYLVDLRYQQTLPKAVTLQAMKANPALTEMALLKSPRLSVQPVTAEQWAIILAMGTA